MENIKLIRLPVERMFKFNKKQINNELKMNDFNKEVCITHSKKADDTTNISRKTIRLL